MDDGIGFDSAQVKILAPKSLYGNGSKKNEKNSGGNKGSIFNRRRNWKRHACSADFSPLNN